MVIYDTLDKLSDTLLCIVLCNIVILLLSPRLFGQSWRDVTVTLQHDCISQNKLKVSIRNFHYEFIGWVQECHFLSNISKFWLFTSYSASTQSWWCFLCFLIFIYLFGSLYFVFTHSFYLSVFFLGAWLSQLMHVTSHLPASHLCAFHLCRDSASGFAVLWRCVIPPEAEPLMMIKPFVPLLVHISFPWWTSFFVFFFVFLLLALLCI